MKFNNLSRVYIISILVIIVATVLTFLPLTNTVQGLLASPIILALISILAQAWKEQLSHERALHIKAKELDFTLAIASHMADVVFDKQVAFCEEYSRIVHEATLFLSQNGPSDVVRKHFQELRTTRAKFSPWLSKELETKLYPFEKALIMISTDNLLIQHSGNFLGSDVIVKEEYELVEKILDLGSDPTKRSPEVASITILEHLRELLGISDFEELRRTAITAAKGRQLE